ncbi:MAG: hypothetical protein B6244_13355 [Candidatus Cloacimonetes bacterium 4572_55]|nr:MAG: hypothetical protein B6244_13355 [Candidatus Cloacimonetes bacterium 4572_55]
MKTLGKNSGFSLLEIMVTVGLIGILVAVAVPNFGKFNQNRMVEAAAQRVVSDLRMLRTVAISQHHWCKVEFFPDELRYVMFVDRNDDLDFSSNERYREMRFKKYFSGVSFARIDGINDIPLYLEEQPSLETISFGSPDNGDLETIFKSGGKVSKSGYIMIALDRDIERNNATGQYLVEVYRIGSIKWWRYDGETWLNF